MIQNSSFSPTYQRFVVDIENYGSKFASIYPTNKVYEQNINKEIVRKNLIEVSIELSPYVINNISQLIKFKYISILQPYQYIYEENKPIKLIFPDLLESQLNQQKLKALKSNQQTYKFLLQLVLTFSELNRRELKWPLIGLEQIYYINEQIFLGLNLYQFNYVDQDQLKLLSNFICTNFREEQELFNKIKTSNNLLDDLEKYLLEKTQFHLINYLEPPYESLLAYILNINEKSFQNLVVLGNSAIKVFNTTETMKQVVSQQLQDSVVYKSSKYTNRIDQQETQQHITRELENLEIKSDYIANCYFYFRIQQYSFLIMKKYEGTVRDVLKKWADNGISSFDLKKQVYSFASKFADGLRDLNEQKVLHRDLKPENLFVEYLNMTDGKIFIADFDRSKQLNDFHNFNPTQANSFNTERYDPPELPSETQSMAYDIFQYGLIVLEVANKGVYVGHEYLSPRMIKPGEFENIYSEQNIGQLLLQKTDYDPTFIHLISMCLKRDPNQRPHAQDLYQQINKLYLRNKIKRVT